MSYALITGASKGIGKAIAFALAKRKYNLLLVARTEDLLKELAAELVSSYGIKAAYKSVDLTQPGAADEIFRWCHPQFDVSILVNNAGYGLSGPMQRYSPEDNRAMLQINMLTPAMLCQLFLPVLLKQSQAYILNVASTSAYQAVPGLNLYAASKSFMLQFSRALHLELKNTPVSVTCVSPGSTETDFPYRAQVGEKALKTAKKVNLSPDEVAAAAVNAMFAKKAEVIVGFINKLGAFFAWLLPKRIVELAAGSIYK
jgi:hypothetical protein